MGLFRNFAMLLGFRCHLSRHGADDCFQDYSVLRTLRRISKSLMPLESNQTFLFSFLRSFCRILCSARAA